MKTGSQDWDAIRQNIKHAWGDTIYAEEVIEEYCKVIDNWSNKGYKPKAITKRNKIPSRPSEQLMKPK